MKKLPETDTNGGTDEQLPETPVSFADRIPDRHLRRTRRASRR